jgi:hypothetical protein
MATSSMDKGLYAAPLGIEEDMGMAPLEIEIEDPEACVLAWVILRLNWSPEETNG